VAFVRTACSHLVERELLLPEDFQERNSQEVRNRVKETLTASAKGVVNFEGIRYNLGSAFKDCEIRIQKITPDRAMVTKILSSGGGGPAAFIRLFERTSPEVKKNAVGKSFAFDAPVGAVDVRAYDSEGRGLFDGLSDGDQQERSCVWAHRGKAKIRSDGVTSLRTLPREAYDRVIFSDVAIRPCGC
jgi:hypothetical protein